MIKQTQIIRDSLWVVELMHRRGRMTLKEIAEQYYDYSGKKMERRALMRFRATILDLFGIIIECNRKAGYSYYIENPEALDEQSISTYLLCKASEKGGEK